MFLKQNKDSPAYLSKKGSKKPRNAEENKPIPIPRSTCYDPDFISKILLEGADEEE